MRPEDKTNALIADLAGAAAAVPKNRVMQRLILALGLGLGLVIFLQMQTAGLRADWTVAWSYVAFKVLACGLAAITWFVLLQKAAVPGVSLGWQKWFAIGVLAVAAAVASFATFDFAGLQRCVGQVLLLSALPYAVFVFALRACAPTKLLQAGFAAGIVAGALGTVGYSLGCLADDAPIVAFRYGSAIFLCGMLGALIGRWVLRW